MLETFEKIWEKLLKKENFDEYIIAQSNGEFKKMGSQQYSQGTQAIFAEVVRYGPRNNKLKISPSTILENEGGEFKGLQIIFLGSANSQTAANPHAMET